MITPIPADAMEAFERRPDDETPHARMCFALRVKPSFAPFRVPWRGEPAALYSHRKTHVAVFTRAVTATEESSDPAALARSLASYEPASTAPTKLRDLQTWLDVFAYDVCVRVLGVPVSAVALDRALQAFGEEAPEGGAFALLDVPTTDGGTVRALLLEHEGTAVVVASLTTAEHCVAAWPVPAEVTA